MRKTLEKHDIFILRRYLGTTRCHDGTQNFLKRKFDTSALKWRVTRVFWIARTEIISKNKRTPHKVTGLYFCLTSHLGSKRACQKHSLKIDRKSCIFVWNKSFEMLKNYHKVREPWKVWCVISTLESAKEKFIVKKNRTDGNGWKVVLLFDKSYQLKKGLAKGFLKNL